MAPIDGAEMVLIPEGPFTMGISEEEFTPPPTLNQHQQQILSELLGYSEEKIKRLREEETENTDRRSKRVKKVL